MNVQRARASRTLRAHAGGSADCGPGDRLHYEMADALLPNGWILDDGCGTGTGSCLIARSGRTIVAIDPDARAIHVARSVLRFPNVSFLIKFSSRLPFKAGSFDGAVSFEVIEHLSDAREYICEIHRVLKSDGLFLMSTPNRCAVEPYYIRGLSPINITHKHEFYPWELQGLLGGRFSTEKVFAVHSSDLEQRRHYLQYQKGFPIPYRLRAHIPPRLRALWMRRRGLGPEKIWRLEPVTWEDLIAPGDLRRENVLVVSRKLT